MRIQWLAFIALSAAAATLAAAPPDAASKLFEGRDLFGLQWASDPQIRPDGRSVAYVRNSNEVMTDQARRAIWIVDVETGAQSALVSGSGSHFSPRWSPDGARLAYVSTGEEGRAQLFVRWLATGASSRIADLTSSPDELEWSRDGKSIAFTMFTPDEAAQLGKAPAKPEGATWAPPLVVITDVTYRADGVGQLKPGYTHAFVVAADGGAPRQLTFGAFNEQGPLSWSPDGKFVYISGNRLEGWRRDPINSEIYQVSMGDGSITPLTSRVGPDNAPVVSPDGSKIAFLGFDDRVVGYQNTELYVMDRNGTGTRSLTSTLDRTIDSAVWARRRPRSFHSVRRQGGDTTCTRLAQRPRRSDRGRPERACARPPLLGWRVLSGTQCDCCLHEWHAGLAVRCLRRTQRPHATAHSSQRRPVS